MQFRALKKIGRKTTIKSVAILFRIALAGYLTCSHARQIGGTLRFLRPSFGRLPLPPTSPSRNGKRIPRQGITKIEMIYPTALSSRLLSEALVQTRPSRLPKRGQKSSVRFGRFFLWPLRRGTNSRPRVVSYVKESSAERPPPWHNKWTVPFHEATLVHRAY